MRNALRAKNKLGFIDGTLSEPESTNPEACMWESCNSMLVSWLFNSIDPALQPSIAYMETVKELWDDLRERFSVKNAPRIHQLKADIAAAKQQGQSVVAYYTRLKGMWDELSNYSRVPVCKCKGCTCDAAAELVKEREEEKTRQFLMGLDDSVFGTVRSNILSMEPLPSLNKVYAVVIQEERHRSMARSQDEKNQVVSFAVQASKPRDMSNRAIMNERPMCTHCGKTGHEVTQCFEIVGFPEGWGRGGRGNGHGGRNGGRGRGRGHASAHAVVGAVNNSVNAPASGKNATGQNASGHGAPTGSVQSIPGLSNSQVQQIMAILSNSNISNSGASNEKLCGKKSNLNWILDSGASHHMTGEFTYLQDVCDVAPSLVGLPNGAQTVAKQEGCVVLNGGLVLNRVLYVPTLKCNLISLSKLINDNGCIVTFTNELCAIQDRNMRMVTGVGELKDGVYYYHQPTSAQVFHTSGGNTYELWHRRMGHPSTQITSILPGVEKNSSSTLKSVCDTCMRAKQTREVFPISLNKALEPFELIHCDIWGAYRVASHCGAHYFLTIVDDFSRAVWVYLMVEKSETGDLLKSFCKMIQTQFNQSVKCIRSDNGLEFKSGPMKKFYAEYGILHQTSCVATPQQNGRVERKHRHILNVARALRFQSHLPIEFWGECVLTAAYLINRTPTLFLKNKTPYEILFGEPPSYAPVRVFGCLCYAKFRTSDKFESRSRKCVFVGYPFGQKGWRVYDLELKEFIVSRDVVFCEDIFPFAQMGHHDIISDSRHVNMHTCDNEGFVMQLDSCNEKHARELDLDARGSDAPTSEQSATGHGAPASRDAPALEHSATGHGTPASEDAPTSEHSATGYCCGFFVIILLEGIPRRTMGT
ncbi:Retroelement pol polyprotein-like [Rhynchospora pubera]|uniref:Retroelement pol polyprotein-like n=1 Tax=Rhynchospora pubera TaxID=906938 RepID=A0AAV8CHU2_9POAL|nr:Retroelement pol polyprotein-like [Rhynchospora pubera]